MKILTVVGARPQFIKAATLSRVIESDESVQEILVHTGQHFDQNMSDVFFNEMDIKKPDYNLEVNGGTHGAMTGQMLEKIESVLIKEKPDWVVVFGDTNSTLAGALAASKLHIKVAHIEAGLRSFNMKMPEEQNRILTDRISNILFCPTEQAINNLKNEGYETFDIDLVNSGDVMNDAALYYAKKSKEMSQVPVPKDDFVLVTCHRAENTDDQSRLKGIISALNEINKEMKVIFPLHPRTKKMLEKFSIKLDFEPIEPIGYFDMVNMLQNCKLVLTDSGGLQKEAYFFDRPCITMRDQTEWVELIENKVNILTGANKDRILDAVIKMQHLDSNLFKKNLYGDGNSAQKILDYIKNYEKGE